MPRDHPDFANPIQLGGNVIALPPSLTVTAGNSADSPVFDCSAAAEVFVELSSDVGQLGQYVVLWTNDPAGVTTNIVSPTYFANTNSTIFLVLGVLAPFMKIRRFNNGALTEHVSVSVFGFTQAIEPNMVIQPQQAIAVNAGVAANGNVADVPSFQMPGRAVLGVASVPVDWRVDLQTWNGSIWSNVASVGSIGSSNAGTATVMLPFSDCRLLTFNQTGAIGSIARCLTIPG